jgi:hypothetical protein
VAEKEVKNIVDEEPETREDGVRVVRTEGRDFRVEGNVVDGYIGVSPEYRTYANPNEKPLLSDEDVEFLQRTDLMTDVEALTETMVQNGQVAGPEDDDESDKDDKSGDEESKTAAKAKAPVSAATKPSSTSAAAGTTTTSK